VTPQVGGRIVYQWADRGARTEVHRAELRVLGPFQIVLDGAGIDVGGPQRRALLALLAAGGGRPVGVPALVEQLWGHHAPLDAARTVRTYVSRLRIVLRPGADANELIVTSPPGYALRLPPDAVDAAHFERLAADGRHRLRAGEPAQAAERLAAALGLWRGDAYAEFAQIPALAAEGARLERLRVAATEDRVEADLAVGLDGDLVAELETLVNRHPGHERLWGQLMTALYRAGRQSDALQAYRRARAALVEASGVEPSPALTALHRQVLAQDPQLLPSSLPAGAAAPVDVDRPAQLPPAVAAFSGRDGELATLDSLLLGDRPTGAAVPLAVIAGTGGVGKTALALRWAYRARDRFPDGQLYVNLRGHAPTAPAPAIEVLAGFLTALGLPSAQVPVDAERAVGLYRTLLADRRMLVVLDDARSAEQVRPLLPGSPRSAVVVTSRYGLGGLVARDGAAHLALDVLAPAEAYALLSRMLGPEADSDPEATAALARLCGYLPLALRIAAANLMLHPELSVADHVAELAADDRLSRLTVDGDDGTAVRVAFNLSYAALPPATARLFRLLGLVPGPDFGSELAAALAGADTGSTATMLARLADAHLLTRPAPGRFAFHDLLRLYAAERAGEVESPAELAAATSRLLDWYLAGVDAGARTLHPTKRRLPVPVPPAEAFGSDAGALSWLDVERPNLVAASRLAARRPATRPYAWLLADSLRSYFMARMCMAEWYAVGETGLAAAEAAQDLIGRAAAELCLADLHRLQGRHQAAIEHYTRAAALAKDGGWDDGEGIVLTGLGMVYVQLGRLQEGADCWQRRLDLALRTGQALGAATTLGNLGLVYQAQGDLARAADHHARGAEQHRGLDLPQSEAICLANLAETRLLQGRPEDAYDQLVTALALHRETGDRGAEAESLRILAAVWLELGKYDRALEVATEAVALAAETGHRPVESTALNTLGAVHGRLGRHSIALADHEQALRFAQDTDTAYARQVALVGLATCHLRLDHLDRAMTFAEHAVAESEASGFRIATAQALTVLLDAHLAAGALDAALHHGRRALDLHRATGHRHGEGDTALLLGRALLAAGDPAAAARSWRDARDLFTAIGGPEAADAEALLSTLDP
jgi:DNA-binding SARP family transcriptional activator/tetratricopeptide (TPR) repeat protein